MGGSERIEGTVGRQEARGWISPLLECIVQGIPVPRDLFMRKWYLTVDRIREQKELRGAKLTDSYVFAWLILDICLYLLSGAF